MRTNRPFNHMMTYPLQCSEFIASVLHKIMTEEAFSKGQNVDVMGELTKHLLRAWWELEQEWDLVPYDSSTVKEDV